MLELYRPELDKIMEFTKKNISVIRTGRANAQMLNGVMVNVYGAMMPLEHVATIGVPEARLITVAPWDKSNMKAIEEALNKADLNINPINDGQMIRLNIPALTEESRKELVKQLKQRLEESKIQVRKIREKMREDITEAEKNKEISQDDKFSNFDKIDRMAADYVKKIEDLGDEKEKEIMTI
jgi:ribosome recycling factor